MSLAEGFRAFGLRRNGHGDWRKARKLARVGATVKKTVDNLLQQFAFQRHPMRPFPVLYMEYADTVLIGSFFVQSDLRTRGLA